MKLIIATNNAGKVREIKSIFQGIYDEVLSLKDAGIKIDVEEDGTDKGGIGIPEAVYGHVRGRRAGKTSQLP